MSIYLSYTVEGEHFADICETIKADPEGEVFDALMEGLEDESCFVAKNEDFSLLNDSLKASKLTQAVFGSQILAKITGGSMITASNPVEVEKLASSLRHLEEKRHTSNVTDFISFYVIAAKNGRGILGKLI